MKAPVTPAFKPGMGFVVYIGGKADWKEKRPSELLGWINRISGGLQRQIGPFKIKSDRELVMVLGHLHAALDEAVA